MKHEPEDTWLSNALKQEPLPDMGFTRRVMARLLKRELVKVWVFEATLIFTMLVSLLLVVLKTDLLHALPPATSFGLAGCLLLLAFLWFDTEPKGLIN